MVLRTPTTVTPDPGLALQHSKAVPAESAPEAQAKTTHRRWRATTLCACTAALGFSFIASRYVRRGHV